MLRNTPCGTRCLKKALVGSGRQVRRDGSGGTGREDWSVGQVGDRSGGQVRRDGSGGLVSGTGRRQVRRTGQGTGHEDVSRDRSGGRVRETGQEGRGDILQTINIRSVNSFTCLLS